MIKYLSTKPPCRCSSLGLSYFGSFRGKLFPSSCVSAGAAGQEAGLLQGLVQQPRPQQLLLLRARYAVLYHGVVE